MADTIILAGSLSALGAAKQLRVEPQARIVVGPGGDVADWSGITLDRANADRLLLAERPRDGAEARAIVTKAADAGMKVCVIEDGRIRRLRLDDLVGRAVSAVDNSRLIPLVEGRRILITGGGGSIGAALARRLSALSPARLTLLDSSELNLFNILHDLPDATPVLADIRDEAAIAQWMVKERPHFVFHAAALKHVPLAEMFPGESVLSNVVGTRNVVEAALGVGADVVFVSTDKAVDPSGVMGATKRLGELYCQALDRRGLGRIIPVRLGNVLGSSGSVGPLFEAQLAAGGPLTVTDPKMTRFFLTIPQAADSLLEAAVSAMERPIEGAVYTVDMGEALPVVELAREIIRLEGLRPGDDVPIVFTGLRPGEKLHESLIAADERRASDPSPGVMAATSAPRSLSELIAAIERLRLLARRGAKDALRHELFVAVSPVRRPAPLEALAS
ncbi:MAG: polysaccharide biosynthesis protein [Hyphomonadaceae bacterium]|nr:polysaccharide biosynthesis protein [Hyphomonadaceae bacterium]